MKKNAHHTEVITVVTPVFNDWASFQKLVDEIDDCLGDLGVVTQIVAVDDGSTETGPIWDKNTQQVRSLGLVEIVHLSRNMGHQRAIAVGLAHVEHHYKSDGVVVMDADGEDSPATLPALIQELRTSRKIIFAQRGDRHESLMFQTFYQVYRILFFILTGRNIRFGNYCAIPWEMLRRVVFLPEIWNHFAAGVMRSALPQDSLLLPRGTRYAGKSRMNFVGLALHGLSAMSVYFDILAVRLMLFTAGVILSTIVGSIVLLYIRFFTNLAIPGWATSVAFGLGIILFQALIFLSLIAFLALNSRSNQMFSPSRHYQDFIFTREVIYERP